MAIKSFQGAQIRKKKPEQNKTLVSDLMARNLVTFSPEQTLQDVIRAFIKHRISGGPVVDRSGKIIGIISDADCMKQISDSRYFNMPFINRKVELLMSKTVITIQNDQTIFDAASLFYNTKLHRFPVLDKRGRLVGQISLRDVLIGAYKLKSRSWKHKKIPLKS
ncbi:MAG: CBS domain-containing protein [Flavobacteriaceae bacterium]|nr:CBS domain-containing protein [Flavobacteriaceae bacterium]MCY4215759.1 CBS domain-containing protein [Flavobacteriaceae bacterium]MCY4254007.1 CBS domain-containing protein [Flavobacteriaceae bacterium]